MALSSALFPSLLVDGPCSGYEMVKRFDEKNQLLLGGIPSTGLQGFTRIGVPRMG